MFKLNLARLINKYQYIFWVALCLNSLCCTEPEEGCLDVTASNYEIDADVDCCRVEEECCCTYPSLSLNIRYKQTAIDSLSVSETNFRLSEVYTLDNVLDSIQIDTFQFFISQTAPVNTDLGDTIKVLETFEFDRLDQGGEVETVTVEDNVTLIDGNQFTYTLGTYTTDIEEVDQVSYMLGLPGNLASVDPEDISSDHKLNNTYNDLYDDISRTYRSIKVNFTLKSGDKQRVIAQEFDIDSIVSTALVVPQTVSRGEPLIILLRINVLDVFKGIIFDTTIEDIGLILNENLKSSLLIVE